MTFSLSIAGDATKEVEAQILDELRKLKTKYPQIAYARFHGTNTGIVHFDASGETPQSMLDAAHSQQARR
jgi:hypothetical protein